MVRFVLALIGISLIALGIYTETGPPLLVLGSLFFAPAGITILIKLIKIIMAIAERRRRKREVDALYEEITMTSESLKTAEKQRREKAIQEQRDLVERFTNSELTREMLNIISNGNMSLCLPEEITIYDDYIQGKVNGAVHTYDLKANRVLTFQTASGMVNSNEDVQFIVRPQVAMAEALNLILGKKYEIYDMAQYKHINVDGEEHCITVYCSDYVVMRHISTLPNKSF